MTAKKASQSVPPRPPPQKRRYLKQADVPAAALDDALRVPQAILDHYAGEPTAPLLVAKALNIDPQGSQLKLLSGAAIAYGLTDGGAQASTITVLDLARQILRPQEEGADVAARREAVLRPKVFGDFLSKYDGHPLPRSDIAENVLEELGVPRSKAGDVFERIVTSADSVGFLQEIKSKQHVHLGGDGSPSSSANDNLREKPSEDVPEPVEPDLTGKEPPLPAQPDTSKSPPRSSELAVAIVDDQRRRRVFITHGKSRELVEPIKKLLEYGELEPVLSVERQSVSKPVPEKVMDEMRSCGAAIIHVDAERTITDTEGNEHVLLNPNVLIEIGAAMAFYGRRFILLVREGVKLPSNLQGLYEVRYDSGTLDAAETIRLLEAIKDIKNYALPTELGEDT